jgi:hypothetical protein
MYVRGTHEGMFWDVGGSYLIFTFMSHLICYVLVVFTIDQLSVHCPV